MLTKIRAVFSTCAALVAIAAWPLAASATTMNFASLSQDGSGSGTAFVNEGLSLNFGGLTFSSTSLSGSSKLVLWDRSDTFHPAGGDSTTSLMEYAQDDTTTITKTGGGVFDLLSISLTEYGPIGGPPTFNVTFTGTRPDASTVTQLFSVNNNVGAPILQGPFSFVGFTGLSSVTVTQGTYGLGTAFQFDNLEIGGSAPATVPEPVTLLLVGSGLVGAAARRRR